MKLRTRACALTFLLFGAAALVGLPYGEPSTAHAAEGDKAAAKRSAERGVTDYNLGRFESAIGHFERAFELDPAPIFLFNIAQCHRQLGNSERALFFYRRYVEAAPDSKKAADVRKRIAELERLVDEQAQQKRRSGAEAEAPGATTPAAPLPAPSTGAPTPRVRTPPGQPEGVTAGAGDDPRSGAGPNARPYMLFVGVGPGLPSLTGRDLPLPTVVSFVVEGARRFRRDRVGWEVGAAVPYSFFKYDLASGASRTAHFPGLLVTGAVTFATTERLELGAQLGAGVLWWAGLEEGNSFTVDGAGASGGPVPMPSVRVAASARLSLGGGLRLALAPAFLWSKPTSGLGDSVSSVSRLELLAQVGYAF